MDGKLIITLNSEDREYELLALGIDFENTSDAQIFEILKPMLLEAEGFDITDENYIIRRATNSQTIYVFPKSPAGMNACILGNKIKEYIKAL